MMATVQDHLGSDFGSRVIFLSITVDPEHDNLDVLR
jgi:cytochrome oxidase Cu insertion factor (SCO1/SenC/PrrC family)